MITLLQDARLTEGVAQHKEDGWARVAKFMGDGLSAQQCRNRWNMYLKYLQLGLNSGNWQPDEARLLQLLLLLVSILTALLACLYMSGEALAGAGATALHREGYRLGGHRK